MKLRFRARWMPICCAALALLLVTHKALGATPFDADGWVTWRVAAVADRPDWCCYRWNAGYGQRMPCDLSLDRRFVGAPDHRRSDLGEVQLWARIENGRIARIEMLNPDCVVEPTIDWRDLGPVDDTRSLAWLTQNGPGEDHHQWISTVAAHAGDRSLELLRSLALEETDTKLRRAALFWMGQLRIEESRNTLLDVMHNDEDPAVREHAIFSYAHSRADDRTEVLIELVENGEQPLQDRKRALFWLAERGDGVEYISRLLLGADPS